MLDSTLRLAVVLFLLPRISGPLAAQACLEREQRFDAGRRVWAIASADFDGDGRVDLVTANRASGTISVLRNRRDGTFASPEIHPAGPRPSFVATADLNGDHRPDLVVASVEAGTISVLLNQGDGTFGPFVPIHMDSHPNFVACADLDGDRHVDLVVANSSSGTVSVFLNRGDGSFARPVVYTVEDHPLYLSSVVCADFDGDGLVDIAAANTSTAYPHTVVVLRNLGGGTFAAQGRYPVHGPGAMVSADMNGDGHPDLLVTDETLEMVSVLLNRGDGTFGEVDEYFAAGFPHSLACADMDGDGDPDVILGCSANRILVLLNDGTGVLRNRVEFRTSSYPASIVATDLDGDGGVDVAVSGGVRDFVSVHRNCTALGF